MADGYTSLSSAVNAHHHLNGSDTTLGQRSSLPAQRASSLHLFRREVSEDTQLDPFYLERSLVNSAPCESSCSWDCDTQTQEDFLHSDTVKISSRSTETDTASQYSTVPPLEAPRREFYPRATKRTAEDAFRPRQSSVSSVHSDTTIPDLTPSSSFASAHSASLCPASVLEATAQLRLHAAKAGYYPSESEQSLGLSPLTPPLVCARPVFSTTPDTPSRGTTPVYPSYAEPFEGLTMHFKSQAMSSSAGHRSKPLPTVAPLTLWQNNAHFGKKSHPHSGRTPIDPSMISPPSLINPVTLEPHTSHFDQAFFIPSNECPSPVPSPVLHSPREKACTPSRERPSTSTSDAHCEHSVWESDSDTESLGPKSLSRKPIDTLRKVRSKVQLRVARSATKLNAAVQDEPPLEKFPPLQDMGWRPPSPDDGLMMFAPRPSRDLPSHPHPHPQHQHQNYLHHHTLRLVAPSTTSLAGPRSRNASAQSDYDMECYTAAAAMQAQSRRRHRGGHAFECSGSLGGCEKPSRCPDECSEITLHGASPATAGRPGIFKRIWGSLRTLSCHTRRDEHSKF